MNKIYIGIDVGKSGFITVYNERPNEFQFYPMPKIGKFIDTRALWKLIFDLKEQASGQNNQNIFACIEDVHAKFGSSAKGTFTFGYVVGLIEMAIVAAGIPFNKVQPKKWQKEMWEGVPLQKKPSSTGKTFVTDTKLMSEIAAKRLFPNIDFRRTEKCKNNDDNLIDSLLLCEFARRNF